MKNLEIDEIWCTVKYIYIVTRNNSNVSPDKEPDLETIQVEKSKN